MAAIFNDLSDPKLIKLLMGGAVGILPTDTVYGLVCSASNQTAVERLYALKKRENKPGTLIAANIEQLVALGFKARYLKAVENFWPGAISIIIPDSSAETEHLRHGLPDLAVRIPADKKINTLLKKVGSLLTTSANQPGGPPAATISEAEVYFGAKVDFYVDAGSLKDAKPSTIIRIVDDAVEIIREGAVKIDEAGRITK